MKAKQPFGKDSSLLFWGVLIILVGLTLTLDSLGVVHVGRSYWRLWPLVMIAIGLTQIVQPRQHRAWGGWLLVGIGLVFVAETLHFGRFMALWPVLLMIAGVVIVKEALLKSRVRPTPEDRHGE